MTTAQFIVASMYAFVFLLCFLSFLVVQFMNGWRGSRWFLFTSATLFVEGVCYLLNSTGVVF
jgi:hypothetical protein